MLLSIGRPYTPKPMTFASAREFLAYVDKQRKRGANLQRPDLPRGDHHWRPEPDGTYRDRQGIVLSPVSTDQE